jgi:hypothetical protein
MTKTARTDLVRKVSPARIFLSMALTSITFRLALVRLKRPPANEFTRKRRI